MASVCNESKPFLNIERIFMLPSFSVFGFSLPTYTIIFSAAFVVCVLIAKSYGHKYGVKKDDAVYASIYGAIGLFLFAKLFYMFTKLPMVISHFSQFWNDMKINPTWAFNYLFGGLVFYGGLIGFVFGVFIYSKQFKVSFIKYFDAFTPLVPFVHGFGRIGCFMAGCCYGIEYHGILAVQFPYNENAPELCDVTRFPVQLLEALCNFIFAAVLVVLQKKVKFKEGQLLGVYLVYYTIARACLELLRGDAVRGAVGGISTSQIISFILIPIAIVLISGKLSKRLAKIGM